MTVVFEIAEAVGDSADGFHFVVEAFGDGVVAGEAPQAGDLFLPTVQGFAERDQVGGKRRRAACCSGAIATANISMVAGTSQSAHAFPGAALSSRRHRPRRVIVVPFLATDGRAPT